MSALITPHRKKVFRRSLGDAVNTIDQRIWAMRRNGTANTEPEVFENVKGDYRALDWLIAQGVYFTQHKWLMEVIWDPKMPGLVHYLTSDPAEGPPRSRSTSVTKWLKFIQSYLWKIGHLPKDKPFLHNLDIVQARIAGSAPERYDIRHEIVSGPDLVKFYKVSKSCMSYLGHMSSRTVNHPTVQERLPADYLDVNPAVALYSLNPDKIKMVVFYLNGTATGRALLWHMNGGITFLDRLYPGDITALNDYYINLAEENGWPHYKGEKPRMTITLNDVQAYPYADTMATMKDHTMLKRLPEGKISLRNWGTGMYLRYTNNQHPSTAQNGTYYIFNQDGEIVNQVTKEELAVRPKRFCAACGQELPEGGDYRVYADGDMMDEIVVCESDYNRYYQYVAYYDSNDDYRAGYVHLSFLERAYDGDFYRKRDLVWSDTLDAYLPIRQAATLDDGRVTARSRVVVTNRGERFDIEDAHIGGIVVWVADQDEWRRREDAKERDGIWYSPEYYDSHWSAVENVEEAGEEPAEVEPITAEEATERISQACWTFRTSGRTSATSIPSNTLPNTPSQLLNFRAAVARELADLEARRTGDS